MNGQHNDEGSTDSPSLSTDVQTLLDDVDRIKKDVRWLRNQEQDSVGISDVAQEVFDALEVLPESQIPNDEAAAVIVSPDSSDDESNPHTKSAIADRLGISEDEFEDAIEHLQDQFLPVVEVELNGQTHYFKEE